MADQPSMAKFFRELHLREEPFLLPNPWDAGSAKLLASLGFEALATTSLGASTMLGTTIANLDAVIENCQEICAVTDLPVNADLENGFADDPEEAAKALVLACEAGAVGGSIEDATGDSFAPIYDFGLAVERIQAAVEVARGLPVEFVLTARAEGLLYDYGGIGDIIKRLQAFEAAGADCLYAPGLKTVDDMRRVVDAIGKPLNVVMGFADPDITLDQLSEIGVRRVSIGAALSRVALSAMMDAAREMKAGRFHFIRDMIGVGKLKCAFGE